MANVMTPEFRVSYPKVFKPELNDMNGKEEYSVVALFPKGADLAVLKQAAQKAIEEKWGPDKTKWPTTLKSPFKEQTLTRLNKEKKTVPNPGHEEGAIYVTFKSTQKPGVVDSSVQDIIVEQDFYPGCWARATVNAYAYDQKGNRGVAFGLQNIQKVKEGEPLSGRMKASTEFAPIEGATGSVNDIF